MNDFSPFIQKASKINERIKELLYPRVRCLACAEERELLENGLCLDCKEKLDQDFALLTRPINSAICHGAFAYEETGPAAGLIRRLKFSGIEDCGKVLGEYCAKAAELLSLDVDLIVPVPISKRRRYKRGFNQSAIIAAEVSRRLNIPSRELIKKKKHTKAQSDLGRDERITNVIGAYESLDAKNLKILLIDDVLTTGATTLECRFVLMRSGASRVYILCAALTPLS
ncbi:MAG: ComF family protein [Christensenellales bacterium]